ncbi:MAG TPA: LCP family protein [Micromonosporaceae bacterium]|jgi:LCP family protein required for cell wall assembly|nr:LCP family protein [Micromonosporaceae bacterium]
MARWVRRVAILAAVVVLLGLGTVASAQLLRRHVDQAIPHADLFGPSAAPSASPSPSPSASPTPPPGAAIKGPLNILIVGLDTRETILSWLPHADTVMILHVTADLSRAYLTSLPRDLVVNVPAFAPAHFGGERTKLTNAMSFGSQVPGSSIPNPVQGFQLLAKVVSNYTGIARFDAGALLTFTGMRRLVDALGGVDIYIDQRIQSIHLQPSGRGRTACGGCANGYSGPRATYDVGFAHLSGWQALDYARQRYTAGADYTRTRHQRQLIVAILAKVHQLDVLTNPVTLANILGALGRTLIFDGRGYQPSDFGYALRKLQPENITLVGLPGTSVYGGGGQYLGESLNAVQSTYFAALRQDALAAWVPGHPNLVNTAPRRP